MMTLVKIYLCRNVDNKRKFFHVKFHDFTMSDLEDFCGDSNQHSSILSNFTHLISKKPRIRADSKKTCLQYR